MRGVLDMEKVKQIMYGVREKPYRPFDMLHREDLSKENEDALPRGRQPGVDYTSFGNLRKIDF